MSEAQADALEVGTTAIMKALERSGVGDDPTILVACLGTVAGCIAAASGRPGEVMAAFNRIAQGIIGGELLTDEPAG